MWIGDKRKEGMEDGFNNLGTIYELWVTACSHHRIPLLPNPGVLTIPLPTFTHSPLDLRGATFVVFCSPGYSNHFVSDQNLSNLRFVLPKPGCRFVSHLCTHRVHPSEHGQMSGFRLIALLISPCRSSAPPYHNRPRSWCSHL